MITYNEEQMEFLKEHEKQLFNATYQNFYRSTHSTLLDKMKAIYDSVAESPYPANWSCGHCVLDFLRHVGKIYFDTKKAGQLTAQQMTDLLNAEMKKSKADENKKSDAPAKSSKIKKSPKKTKK